MICVKCKKEIPDGSLFCNFCGKKQTAESKRTKYHKREHGTGTIRKDPRNRKPWIAYAPSVGYLDQRKYIGSYATRAEASAAIEDFIKNGRPDLYNATLADIHDRWKAAHYPTVGTAAQNLYDAMWKRFSKIENVKMRDIRTEHFQSVVNTATSKSAADTLSVMCLMMSDYALKNDIIQKNYAEFILKPKFEKKEKKIFSSEDISKLWEHSDDVNVQAVLIMIYTGFRIGEIVNIKKSDVHLDEGYIVGGEKTDAGKNRIVPLPPNIPEISDFLRDKFIQSESDRLYPYTVAAFRSQVFYQALITIGLASKSGNKIISDYTPHSTRHTFASLSSAAGIRAENLQKIIGHADFSTTANVYIHQDVESLREEMKKISK